MKGFFFVVVVFKYLSPWAKMSSHCGVVIHVCDDGLET